VRRALGEDASRRPGRRREVVRHRVEEALYAVRRLQPAQRAQLGRREREKHVTILAERVIVVA
jgi:hypothetical protein